MDKAKGKCGGCPFYQNGKGFIPPSTHGRSPLLLVGDMPTGDDLRGVEYTGYNADGKPLLTHTTPGPFKGYRGFQLSRLGYSEVNQDYVIRCTPPSNQFTREGTKRVLKYDQTLRTALYHCTKEYQHTPPSTKLIIASGELAWDHLLDQTHLPDTRLSLTEWRGFLQPYPTPLPIYGVNDLGLASYDKVERYLGVKDWAKIPRILNHTWPEKEPTDVIIVNKSTTTGTIDRFFEQYLTESTTPLIIDTEYTPKDQYLRLFGCGYHTPSGERYLQLYWSNSQNPGAPRNHVVAWMFRLREDTGGTGFEGYPSGDLAGKHQGFLFQNAAADNPILDKNWGFYGRWGWPTNYHDTMLLHAKVESELPHSLMFLESIYSRRAKKKHLAHSEELKYHLGDLSTTLDAWVGLQGETTPGMWQVYTTQDLPVFPLVQWSHTQGIKVDHAKVDPLYTQYQGYLTHCITIARCYTGKGEHFNLGSGDHLKEWLYGREGFKPYTNRITKRNTMDGDTILRYRNQWGKQHNVPEAPDSEDGAEIWTPAYLEGRIEDGCHPLLECKAAFNFYEHKVAKFIRNQIHDEKGGKLWRVYPQINIHTQATGRHSTTNPSLANWTDELQGLLVPDPGWCWVGGDYSGQEVWIYACMIGDTKTLDQLQKGYDTHTIAMCDFWGWDYPSDPTQPYKDKGWMQAHGIEGKNNPYRKWAKANSLALKYMKAEDKLHLTPGSRGLGVDQARGTEMAVRYLERNPAIKQYRDSLYGTRPKQSESFCGRVRKLNEIGNKLLREYINSPIQGGGADILNHTIIRGCAVDPTIHYVYGVHDSFWFTINLKREKELTAKLQQAILSPYVINGYEVVLPVEWKRKGADGVVSYL